MGFDIPGLSKVRKAFSKAAGQDRLDNRPESLEGCVLAGRFEIVRKIGTGGMGSVYLARQTSMNRDVAIKVLHPDKVNDQEARERFRVEATAVSRLRSPHTITVYDFGEDDSGGLFLVMELLEGGPLSDLIARKAVLPIAMAVSIVDQILDSLEEAHRAGVLHRDLKPDNIFVKENPDGSVFIKVLDFGIAKVMGGPMASRTWAGVVFGTPSYMSPEQVMGRDLDQRTDLYAVAVMLFEMLTGRLPITGGSPIEIGVKKVRSRAPSLETAAPALQFPPGASAFVAAALEPDRRRRPTDVAEFRRMMHAAFELPAEEAGKGQPRPRKQAPAAGNGSRVLVALEDVITSAWKYDGGKMFPPEVGPGPAPKAARKITTTTRKASPLAGASGAPSAEPAPGRTPEMVDETPLADFDRRTRRRVPRLVTVRCFYAGRKFQATVSDISGTGGFINSPEMPSPGHWITVSFAAPGTREYTISVIAEVIRVSDGAGGGLRGFAVRWVRLKARGELAGVSRFLETVLGIELHTSLPDTTSISVWEYNFEDGRFV